MPYAMCVRSLKQPKPERLEARLSSAAKREIERAAILTGRSITDFVVHSATIAARATIREQQVMKLAGEDGRAFAEALLNPPAPNAKLKAAFVRHRKLVSSV
jgi:uncharacterized protein (DUF1778 family)